MLGNNVGIGLLLDVLANLRRPHMVTGVSERRRGIIEAVVHKTRLLESRRSRRGSRRGIIAHHRDNRLVGGDLRRYGSVLFGIGLRVVVF